jgi:surface-anchored protein
MIRSSIRLLVAGAAAVLIGHLAPARADFNANEYLSGHADIAVAYSGGSTFDFVLAAAPNAVFTTGGVLQPPLTSARAFAASEVTTVVPPWSAGASGTNPRPRPSGANWDFIGVNAGDPYYLLPFNNISGVPFLGIATDLLNPADWTTAVTWALEGLSGPGAFSLYQVNIFGTPTALMASSNGITSADSFPLGVGSHQHYNYAFSQQGIYDVTFRVTATNRTAGVVSSTGTYRFNVGPVPVPEPTSLALLGLGLGFGLANRRRIRQRPVS